MSSTIEPLSYIYYTNQREVFESLCDNLKITKWFPELFVTKNNSSIDIEQLRLDGIQYVVRINDMILHSSIIGTIESLDNNQDKLSFEWILEQDDNVKKWTRLTMRFIEPKTTHAKWWVIPATGTSFLTLLTNGFTNMQNAYAAVGVTSSKTFAVTTNMNSFLSSKTSLYLIALLVISSTVPFAIVYPVIPDTDVQLECIDYSTSRDKFSKALIKPSDIDEEIETIANSGVYCLRVFFTDRTLPYILDSVQKHNEVTDQKIVIHPVISPLKDASKLKDAESINLLLNYTEIIKSLVVGNGILDETIENEKKLLDAITEKDELTNAFNNNNSIINELQKTIDEKDELRKTSGYNDVDLPKLKEKLRTITVATEKLEKDIIDIEKLIESLRDDIIKVDELRDNILQIKEIFASYEIEVTTAESSKNLLDNPDLVKDLDYVTLLHFPFYETSDPDIGLDNIFNLLDDLQKKYSDKTFFVVSGWPSAGIDTVCDQASGIDQNKFIHQFIISANDENDVGHSIFAAYDENWKSYAKLWTQPEFCDNGLNYVRSDSSHKYGIFSQEGVLKPHNINLVGNNIGIIPSDAIKWESENQIILELNLNENEYQKDDFAVVNIDSDNFDGTMNVSVFNDFWKVYDEEIQTLPYTVNIHSTWEYDSIDDVRVEFKILSDDNNDIKPSSIGLPSAFALDEKSSKPLFEVSYAILSPQFVCDVSVSSCKHVNIQDLAWVNPLIIISAMASLSYPTYKTTKKRHLAKKEFIKNNGETFYVSGFIDIVNFTKYTGSLSAENTVRLVTIFNSEMQTIIQNHDGEIIKKTGDGILFYFRNTATGKVEDFVPVYDCCQEIANSCPTLNKKLEQKKLRPIKFRLSLSYGPTTIVNDNGVKDIFGSSVNLASKINHMGYSLQTHLLRLISLSTKKYVVINSNLYRFLDEIKRSRNDRFISYSTSGHLFTDELHWHKIHLMEIDDYSTKHSY